ncbi:hypothetical protein CesoFtcFv8_000977 [Champsocephalus esox]|uniref:Uncharacterized protein n=1 Tax=Champsocephalus esox TaxID=159716 RepID=A0AAN8HKA1_9TELE|nr:hypothetical protein CesoFtcFv8_000977 [Champsocephalus esox]
MPIVPEGISGSALASMQRRCEMKKKEDEALHLCLPRRVQPLPSQQQSFTQANSARFKAPDKQRSQPTPSPQPRLETRASWPRKYPVPAAAQAQPTQNLQPRAVSVTSQLALRSIQ